MKKNTIKAFTLVEMLIVIVIIGILIASLMPRMQSAQWRARDVARKNDLSQIQTAVITSQSDRGSRPGMEGNVAKDVDGGNDKTTANTSWLKVSEMAKNLQDAWMTQVPKDPNGSNDNYGLWSSLNTWNTALWEYIYMVGKRNWVDNAWFALMAKTEVEWSSNWVVCQGGTTTGQWYLTGGTDLAHITLCSTVTLTWDWWCKSNQRDCYYEESAELRYLLVY
jgi:prepilin-type N-terminal cleavage/methylation domain-containing protein